MKNWKRAMQKVHRESDAREERLQSLFAAADPPVRPSEALRERAAAICRDASVASPVAAPASRVRWKGLGLRAPRWARVGLAVTVLIAVLAGVHWASVGVNPHVTAAIEALEAKERRLDELRVTYDCRRVSSQDRLLPTSPDGRGRRFT